MKTMNVKLCVAALACAMLLGLVAHAAPSGEGQCLETLEARLKTLGHEHDVIDAIVEAAQQHRAGGIDEEQLEDLRESCLLYMEPYKYTVESCNCELVSESAGQQSFPEIEQHLRLSAACSDV